MKVSLRRLLRSSSGATGIEYAFLSMFVALAIMAAVRTLGLQLRTPFNNIAIELNASVLIEDPPPD
jgi:pilus assembly protein Flp/PilA